MKRILTVLIVITLLSTGVIFAANVNGIYKGFPIANITLNGVKINSDVPAIVFDSRTLLPVRAVTEAVNSVVQWDQRTQTAIIIKPAINMIFAGDIVETEDAGQNCPHKEYTHPILEAMLVSDGIVFASPVYALAETAQIKSLLDHFASTYLNHRPNEEMFDKIAFVITTAAGGGTGRVISTISRNMLFWGVKRTVKCKVNMWAKNWDQMDDARRIKAENQIKKQTLKFYRLTKKRYRINTSISGKILHHMFKGLIKGYADTEPDKIYWKNKGWI